MKFKSYLHFLNSGFLKSQPVEMTFFITSRCNFRCHHCFYWREIKGAKDELTLKEIEKFTKSLPRLLRVLLTGGEPFIRNDLVEICQLFYQNVRPLHITIPTNAYFSDKIVKDAREILRYCPETFINISLSLDGLGEKRDEITDKEGGFDALLETNRRLSELKGEFKNLGVTVITTQTRENEEYLDEIFDFAMHDMKVDNFGFTSVRGNPKYEITTCINIELYRKMTRRIEHYLKEQHASGLRFLLRNYFLANRELVHEYTFRTLSENRYQLKCFSGLLRFVVNESGDIYPCETLMELDSQYRIGNLKAVDMNFGKLWNSQKRKEIRRLIEKKKCFCTHGCDMSLNTFFNIGNIPRLICKSFSY